MENELLVDIISALVEFLEPQIAEYYEADGRGVFFVEMESNEIRYTPEALLGEKIPDEDALGRVSGEVAGYDPQNQICLMIFADNEVFFQVVDIESGEERAIESGKD